MPETDYPVLLNNFLQRHPTGNLTSHFVFDFTREGPDDNATHIATAKFHGVTLAVGKGKSKGAAKLAAARMAYEYFATSGVPAVW